MCFRSVRAFWCASAAHGNLGSGCGQKTPPVHEVAGSARGCVGRAGRAQLEGVRRGLCVWCWTVTEFSSRGSSRGRSAGGLRGRRRCRGHARAGDARHEFHLRFSELHRLVPHESEGGRHEGERDHRGETRAPARNRDAVHQRIVKEGRPPHRRARIGLTANSGAPHGDGCAVLLPLLPVDLLRPGPSLAHVEDDEVAGVRGGEIHVGGRLFESPPDGPRL